MRCHLPLNFGRNNIYDTLLHFLCFYDGLTNMISGLFIKINPCKKHMVLKVLAFFCLFINTAFSAQTTTTTNDASIVTYEKQFFELYAPVTLIDMLQRVPGAPEILNASRQRSGGGGQNQERGFGSGGDQILIDGKRLAGKSNNINDTLGRISANSVEKIELIRGAAGGLDVQSQGLVINILLSEGAAKSTTFWNITSETKQGNSPGLEFLLSHSGSKNKLDYVFSAERASNKSFNTEKNQFYDTSNLKTGDRTIGTKFLQKSLNFNSNLTYNFEDGAILRLNGLFETGNQNFDQDRVKTGDDASNLLWSNKEDQGEWEFGGDYTKNLGKIGQFKAVFVANRGKDDQSVNRSQDINTTPFIYTVERTIEIKKEKILRASISKTLNTSQTIEFGGEAAFNSFNKSFDSKDRDLAGDPYVTVAADNVKIKENRYEIFTNHTFNISNSLVLQSSLTTEFSQIIADNILPDLTISRRNTNFTYIKPRINIRYDVTPRNQIRATIEKKVSQLNFNNFVTRYDTRNEEFKYGNTNIRPEQIWEFLTAYEHRFANDGGSLEIEGFFRNYTDKIVRTDFTEYVDLGFASIGREAFFALPPNTSIRSYIEDTGSGFISKSGNVGKASSYGFNIKSSLRLGLVGLTDAVLSAKYTFEKSKIIDQFTRLERSFSRLSDHIWDLNYRHDLTNLGLSYGGRVSFSSNAANHDIRYYQPYNPQANVSVFAEYNIFDGIKVRIDAKQLTQKRGTSSRYNYSDHIRINSLSSSEKRQTTVPRELEISIQGTF